MMAMVTAPKHTPVVMFVDDDPDYRKLVSTIAKTMDGVFITIRHGARSALEYLEDFKYEVDAVVTDLAMGASDGINLDGVQLTEKIRMDEGRYRGSDNLIQIYWSTGKLFYGRDPDDIVVQVATKLHVRKIFPKPYDPVEIINEVRECLTKCSP